MFRQHKLPQQIPTISKIIVQIFIFSFIINQLHIIVLSCRLEGFRDVKDISAIEKLLEMPGLLEVLAQYSGKLINCGHGITII